VNIKGELKGKGFWVWTNQGYLYTSEYLNAFLGALIFSFLFFWFSRIRTNLFVVFLQCGKILTSFRELTLEEQGLSQIN